MLRCPCLVLLAGLSVLAAVGPAAAQSPLNRGRPAYGAGSRPPLSPYLNLIRPFDPAAHYYLGTRAALQRRDDAISQRAATNDLRTKTGDLRSKTRELDDVTEELEGRTTKDVN